jgi:hypothetical protein
MHPAALLPLQPGTDAKAPAYLGLLPVVFSNRKMSLKEAKG